MESTTVGSEIMDPNQKFVYEYDFAKSWIFWMELINVSKEENPRLEYPATVRTEGIAPSQYGTKGLVSDKLAEMEEKYDLVRKTEEKLRRSSNKLESASCQYAEVFEEKVIMTTDGADSHMKLVRPEFLRGARCL